MRWDCSEVKKTYSTKAAFESSGNSHARRWQSRLQICSEPQHRHLWARRLQFVRIRSLPFAGSCRRRSKSFITEMAPGGRVLHIHALNMHTQSEPRVLVASEPVQRIHSVIRLFGRQSPPTVHLLCATSFSHVADSGNKEEEKCLVRKERPEVELHGIQLPASSRGSPPRAGLASFFNGRGTGPMGAFVPCRHHSPGFLLFRRHHRASTTLNKSPRLLGHSFPELSTTAFAMKQMIQSLPWFVVHFSDDLVPHRGSREAINVQIHKRLGEQPWLVPNFGHFPPGTWNPLPFQDAPRRPQRQPFVIHFFSKGIHIIAPYHHHGRWRHTSLLTAITVHHDICSASTTPDTAPATHQYRKNQRGQQRQRTGPAAPELKDPARLLSQKTWKTPQNCRERMHVNRPITVSVAKALGSHIVKIKKLSSILSLPKKLQTRVDVQWSSFGNHGCSRTTLQLLQDSTRSSTLRARARGTECHKHARCSSRARGTSKDMRQDVLHNNAELILKPESSQLHATATRRPSTEQESQ